MIDGKDLELAAQSLLDREWRMANLYSIIDKRGEQVRFKENPIQKKIRLSKAKRKRILKARQFGVSTGAILDIFDRTIWKENVTSVILAHEQDAIKKLFRIVQRAYNFLPEPLRPKLDRGGGSKYEFYFPEINSRIYCDLESRADTIQNLHISEAAFIDDVNRIRATVETVPLETGRVTVETTPNGMGNHFHDAWIDTNSTYEHLFFPWYMHSEYKIATKESLKYTQDELDFIDKAEERHGIIITPNQIAFRRHKKSELKELFLQEYPEDDATCFLASGNPAIDPMIVQDFLASSPQPIEEDPITRIYKHVNKGSTYVIGADTAEGVKGDYSAAVVFDVSRKEQVAALQGYMKPSDFAHEIAQLARRYAIQKHKLPLVAVERNNHGHAVLLELDEHIRYPNLYKAKDGRVGWVTDRISRPIMMNALIDAVESKNFNFPDRPTLQEFLTLKNQNGRIEAAEGKHDDLAVAAAIGLQMCVEVKVSEVYTDIASKILL
jgi:hypothetical protein